MLICLGCSQVSLVGCATAYRAPDPAMIPVLDTRPLQQRADTMQHGKVRVSVAALSAAESQDLFDLPLARDGIQPVWLKVENANPFDYLFFPLDVDPDYYSPFELAWKYRSKTGLDLNELGLVFTQHHFPPWVPHNETVSGFVFTKADEGAKAVAVDLMSDQDVKRFDFVVEVPGLRADYLQVDWDGLYDASELRNVDAAELRRVLESLPCCALGGDQKTPADPLNLVVIGPGAAGLKTFIARGWDLTETIHGAAIWRTIQSSLFGHLYRNSPVSPLYVFGRPQDIAMQKARKTVNERNHLRLWLTPYSFRGREVWIGQISRDIGIRLTSKTLVTHKIDPDVDETRDYLLQDLIRSNYVKRFGYLAGVGTATIETPRFNYTGDPYWTDGLRAIIEISKEPVLPSQVHYLDWAEPKAVQFEQNEVTASP